MRSYASYPLVSTEKARIYWAGDTVSAPTRMYDSPFASSFWSRMISSGDPGASFFRQLMEYCCPSSVLE